MSSRFSQLNGIVPMAISTVGDYNAGFSADSVNMARYNHACVVIIGDDAVAGAGILTVMAGATDGAETAAITFSYRHIVVDVGAALADQLSAPATSASLSLTEAYIKSGMYVIEWEASDLLVSGTHYQYATPVLDATGTAGYVAMVAILSEPRYAKQVMPAAIPIA